MIIKTKLITIVIGKSDNDRMLIMGKGYEQRLEELYKKHNI